MLVIKPNECIDCGVCIPECPADAIIADTVEGAEKWVEFNQKYAQLWPKITVIGVVPEDADQWLGVGNKLEHHFNENPGHTNGNL